MIAEKTTDYTVYVDKAGYSTVAVKTEAGVLRTRKRKNETIGDVLDRIGRHDSPVTLTEHTLRDLIRAAILLDRAGVRDIRISYIVQRDIAAMHDAAVAACTGLDESSTVGDLLASYCMSVDSSQSKTKESKCTQKSRAKAALMRLTKGNLSINAHKFVSGTKLPPYNCKRAGDRAILLYGRKMFKMENS